MFKKSLFNWYVIKYGTIKILFIVVVVVVVVADAAAAVSVGVVGVSNQLRDLFDITLRHELLYN